MKATEDQSCKLAGITAVLANWNRPDLTIRAVEALVNDGVPANRIVVVDDASSDDCVRAISSGSTAASGSPVP